MSQQKLFKTSDILPTICALEEILKSAAPKANKLQDISLGVRKKKEGAEVVFCLGSNGVYREHCVSMNDFSSVEGTRRFTEEVTELIKEHS